MGKTNDIPLYKRAHFRRAREVITEIAKNENINIHNYDLFNIRVYDAFGQSVAGKNVSYNTDNGRAIFVEDNKYDIFEVPKNTNVKDSPYGEFIFFIHNTSYDYYMLGILRVTLDEYATKSKKIVTEAVKYNNCGQYLISYEKHDNHITKAINGIDFDPGYLPSAVGYNFDSFNARKHSYDTSHHKILRNLGLRIESTKNLTDNKKVEIYNKNKKKGPRKK